MTTEREGWDCYIFESNIQGQEVSWVEAEHAHVRLKGTNAWFLQHFNVYVIPADQNILSTGISIIHTNPYTWLDNTTSNGWDYYETGKVGTGRLNF